VLYNILKPLVSVFYRIFYQLQVKGTENLPKEKAFVLVPNHVNGFIDPVITGLFSRRKIRFFARGDVFKGRFVKWLLNDLNVSPMYRISEGYSELKKNDQTFEECRRLLAERKAILIFPEGICIQDRRVKKLKKGLARIILSVEQEMKGSEDILIIPVGLNYSAPSRFRSRLFIKFGEPVALSLFRALYEEDKVKAINECTRQMEEEIKKQVVLIDNPDHDELYDSLVEIYSRQSLEEEGKDPFNLELEYEKNRTLAAKINELDLKNPEQAKVLSSKVALYMQDLMKYKLRDNLLRHDRLTRMNLKSILSDFLLLWFGLPLYWIGLALNYPPFKLARKMADDKAKMKEFYASIFANLSMLLWPPYYVFQLVLAQKLSHTWWITIIWAMLVPATGWFVLGFYPVMKKAFGRWKLLGLVKKNKEEAERLIYERAEIVGMIRGLE